MSLAKRSFMGKVLAAMQMNNPTDYMFSKMMVESYLEDDELYFSNISMSGDSMAFKGAGDLDLVDGKIDLDLSAYGNNIKSNPSLIESLARGIGAAIVKVKVDGTTDDPRVKVSTLPVIQGGMGILGEKR